MKRFLLYTLLSLTTLPGIAQTITAKGANGRWTRATDWDKNRMPQSSDTVTIPKNRVMVLDNNTQLEDVVVVVSGTLTLQNGKLSLDEKSKVIVEEGGKIVGFGNNDQLRLDNTLKFRGSQGFVAGPAIADISTGTTFVAMATLPVRFVSFEARKQSDKVKLTWATDQEKNNSHFNIEKSVDGKSWSTIAMVFAKESASINRYEYVDASKVAGSVYYRIRQVDIDGGSSYSKVKSLRALETSNGFQVFSPSQKNLRVTFAAPLQSKAEVKIFNSNGQVVSTKFADVSASKVDITENSLSSGVYVVQVMNQEGSVGSRKVIL